MNNLISNENDDVKAKALSYRIMFVLILVLHARSNYMILF